MGWALVSTAAFVAVIVFVALVMMFGPPLPIRG